MKKPVFRGRPEATLQKKIIAMLQDRGWFVRQTHGNAYQKGFPDLFAYNEDFMKAPFGPLRWIDTKVEGKHRYTKAQCIEWPEWEEGNVGIWILMGATEEWYGKLFQHPNFREYWLPAYDKYRLTTEEILEGME